MQLGGCIRSLTQRGSASPFRQLGEPLLDVVVPAHRPNRVSPTALHLLTGRDMGIISGPDEFLEMLILRLDDLVGALAAVRNVAGATELSAGHGLHMDPPSLVTPGGPRASGW